MRLSNRDTNTILAALRYYQASGTLAKGSGGIHDIATNFGAEDIMDAEEIDELCERINV